MLSFAIRRLLVLLLTLLTVSFATFAIVGSNEQALRTLAINELGTRTPPDEQISWVQREIFHKCPEGERNVENCEPYPLIERYWDWLRGFVVGDWGYSNVYKKHILGYEEFRTDANGAVILDGNGDPRPNRDPWGVINERGYATAVLMFWVFVPMVGIALVVGVFAGINEGSRTDRGLSILAIGTTSAPEYVTGVLFAVLLASTNMSIWVGLESVFNTFALTDSWFDAWADRPPLLASAAIDRNGINFSNLFLPALAVGLYGFGYIARMTRASMAEEMSSQYVRTAILKGVPRRQVVVKHALRNALIAPFTVIMLQFPWLLSGVVIVELLFNYRGLGFALNDAARNMDFNLIVACSVISVIVVLLTQFISDIGYILLNPRLRER